MTYIPYHKSNKLYTKCSLKKKREEKYGTKYLQGHLNGGCNISYYPSLILMGTNSLFDNLSISLHYLSLYRCDYITLIFLEQTHLLADFLIWQIYLLRFLCDSFGMC